MKIKKWKVMKRRRKNKAMPEVIGVRKNPKKIQNLVELKIKLKEKSHPLGMFSENKILKED